MSHVQCFVFMNFKNKLGKKHKAHYESILVWRQRPKSQFALLARC